jgi:hypothetical protein
LLTRKAKNLKFRNFKELDQLEILLKNNDIPNWKDRLEYVDKLANIGVEYFEKVKLSKFYFSYFDRFLELIQDANIRVQVQSFDKFIESILPVFGVYFIVIFFRI